MASESERGLIMKGIVTDFLIGKARDEIAKLSS